MRELAKQGIYKTNEVYYIENQDINIINPVMSLQAAKKTGKIAKVVHSLRTYSSETQELSKGTKGMSYWLDVVWNLAIGFKTKYAWKAATTFINQQCLENAMYSGMSVYQDTFK